MASVKDYLKKLLYQYDCVVVPEFGAFLTHYQSATFTESSGLYLPPRRRVAFNEALRLDDGILANYVMLHEPVTREGAQRHINAFVHELRQQVDTTGRFEIDGIGTFTRNDEGRLQFDPSLRQNFFGEAFGMSALATPLVVPTPVAEPVLEAQPITTLGPVRVLDEAETELTSLRPALPYWRVAAAALLVGSLGLVSYFSVINPGQPLQSSLNPANLFRLPTVTYDRPATKPASVAVPAAKPVVTRAAAPAPTAVPVPVKPTPVASAPALTAVTKPVTAPVSKKRTVVKTAPVAVIKPVRTGPQYTIFAGSFASKRNAINLQRRLRRAGYTDAYIIPPVVQGKLYKVAAAGTTVSEDALTLQAAVSKLAGVPAFVFKH